MMAGETSPRILLRCANASRGQTFPHTGVVQRAHLLKIDAMTQLMDFHAESSQSVPIVDRCDVLVAGAGPAGVAAAIAAGRAGYVDRITRTTGWDLDERAAREDS